jgi:hypothetical protein
MVNAARSPTFYEFDSADLLRLYREMDDLGEEPVVIYHSHTATEAYPSRTDISYASEPLAHYVLVSTRECGPEELCAAGQCHPRCDAGETACAAPASGGVERCVDTSRDPEHCGACGVRCGYGELCDNGRCGVRCGVGFTACQGACVDVRWDPAHCGACGYRCGAHQACAEGRCIAFCPNDFLDCDGVCRDPSTDRAHCGACDRACAEGEGCFEGRCTARGAP